jgi:hypothetical protein
LDNPETKITLGTRHKMETSKTQKIKTWATRTPPETIGVMPGYLVDLKYFALVMERFIFRGQSDTLGSTGNDSNTTIW